MTCPSFKRKVNFLMPSPGHRGRAMKLIDDAGISCDSALCSLHNRNDVVGYIYAFYFMNEDDMLLGTMLIQSLGHSKFKTPRPLYV